MSGGAWLKKPVSRPLDMSYLILNEQAAKRLFEREVGIKGAPRRHKSQRNWPRGIKWAMAFSIVGRVQYQ